MNQKKKTQLKGKKETKTSFGVALTPTLVKQLDDKRGFVSRSTIIQILISNFVNKKEKGMGNPFSQSQNQLSPRKKGVVTSV